MATVKLIIEVRQDHSGQEPRLCARYLWDGHEVIRRQWRMRGWEPGTLDNAAAMDVIEGVRDRLEVWGRQTVLFDF